MAGTTSRWNEQYSILKRHHHWVICDRQVTRWPDTRFCRGVCRVPGGPVRLRWVKAPSDAELRRQPHSIAQRVGRSVERQGLLERDAESSYLTALTGAAPGMSVRPSRITQRGSP